MKWATPAMSARQRLERFHLPIGWRGALSGDWFRWLCWFQVERPGLAKADNSWVEEADAMFKIMQGLVKKSSGWTEDLPSQVADKIIDEGDEREEATSVNELTGGVGQRSKIDRVIDALAYTNCCKVCVGKTSASTCWWCRGGRLPGVW
jgi:hypothetical protein